MFMVAFLAGTQTGHQLQGTMSFVPFLLRLFGLLACEEPTDDFYTPELKFPSR